MPCHFGTRIQEERYNFDHQSILFLEEELPMTKMTSRSSLFVVAGLLLIASPIHAQTEQRPTAGPPAIQVPSPAQPSLRIVLFNKKPWICPLLYWGADCSGALTLGALHNAALAATVGAQAPTTRRVRGEEPTVARVVARLEKWTPAGPLAATIRNAEEMSKLTHQLTEQLQAARMVDREGRFVRDAFGDPSKLLTYLETSGRMSPALGSTVRQALSKNMTFAEFAKALDQGRWSGSDVLAASIMSDMTLASAKYWGRGTDPANMKLVGQGREAPPQPLRRGRGPLGPLPDLPAQVPHVGFWDLVGGLLLSETGPGSIIGGYLMSCAAAGEWL